MVSPPPSHVSTGRGEASCGIRARSELSVRNSAFLLAKSRVQFLWFAAMPGSPPALGPPRAARRRESVHERHLKDVHRRFHVEVEFEIAENANVRDACCNGRPPRHGVRVRLGLTFTVYISMTIASFSRNLEKHGLFTSSRYVYKVWPILFTPTFLLTSSSFLAPRRLMASSLNSIK